MRQIRLTFLAIIGFLSTLLIAFTPVGQIGKQILSFFFCLVFSFNSSFCLVNGVSWSEFVALATTPAKITSTISNQATSLYAQNPNNSSLSGVWIRQGTSFTGDENGCNAGYSGELIFNNQPANSEVEFSVTQQNNQLIFPDENIFYSSSDGSGSYIMSTRGTRLGNQVNIVYSGGGFTSEFIGIISADGNRITGETVCRYGTGSKVAKGTFNWIRSTTTTAATTSIIPSDRPSFEQAFKQADVDEAVRLFDNYQTKQYQNYLGLDSSQLKQEMSAADISHALYNLYQSTGVKPALLQLVALEDRVDAILINPTSSPNTAQKEHSSRKKTTTTKQNQSQSPKNQSDFATHKIVLDANRQNLVQVANRFRSRLTIGDRLPSRQYLESAQQLYKWFISPLELELTSNGIETLIVSADTGLRSLPIAAFHDGQQFLIEKYSFALIPSFRLTDTRLGDVSNLKLLVMGISDSTQGQNPLPAAEIEVNALSNELWQGQGFLNEDTTIERLKKLSLQQQLGIIHLATHADFQPGKLSSSYIQFWNEKLPLDELRKLSQELEWDNLEMLVLSACRTALGDEEAELGFTGLAVQAGVKTGIGTLWYISDAGSLGLMTEFYLRLKTAPNKAEALRQAQLAMLDGSVHIKSGQLQLSNGQSFPLSEDLAQIEELNFTHPYFWSGFTIIGNWN